MTITYTNIRSGRSASSLPHGYHNAGSAVARILWVNTPPSL